MIVVKWDCGCIGIQAGENPGPKDLVLSACDDRTGVSVDFRNMEGKKFTLLGAEGLKEIQCSLQSLKEDSAKLTDTYSLIKGLKKLLTEAEVLGR